MNMPLLDIQPPTLKFVVDLNKQTSCIVKLTNTTHQYVAFKVKTTSPKKYCVRPNVGVIAPKSSFEFTVIMQAFKEPPPDLVCKDKFLIQSTTVSAETTDDDISNSMFSKAEGKHVEENKLRVTLVQPSDSPEQSPINGTTKQEAIFEDSILKDRGFTQSESLAPPQYLQAADNTEELQPTKMEDLNTVNDLKATNNLDTPVKKVMDTTPKDQGFTNGITYPDEPKITKERDFVQYVKGVDELKLVKDVEDMKQKVHALESKLKQADSTILKLIEERSISSQHRETLQHELAGLKTKKIVKEVYVGFPLLFVCTVAFISIVIGYSLRT